MAIGDNSDGPRRHFDTLEKASWPPDAARVASASARIPVTIRLVWRDRGEHTVDGYAIAWTNQHVKVTFDQVLRIMGAQATWLDAADVRRLEQQ